MKVKDILPKSAEDFRYTIEQALRGVKHSDRRLTYHYIRRKMNITWDELMNTPYEVVLSDLTIIDVENKLREYDDAKSRQH